MDAPKEPQTMNIWIAALAAVAVQPVVFIARLAVDFIDSPQQFYGLGFFLLAVMAVAGAVVLILGIPTFLLLRRLHRESWTSLGIAGFLIGALPFAFFWPSQLNGFSAGQSWHGKYVETYVNGIPTNYAWLSYGENLLFSSLHGLVGALVFYSVWRWREHQNVLQLPTSGVE